MIGGPVRMSYQQIGAIAGSPGVRRKMSQVADRIAATVGTLAAQAGDPDMPVTRTDGTRPGGRPFSRITVPIEHELGTSGHSYLGLLGLAIRR